MSEMKVFCSHSEMVPLERLVPNPRNPNKHPDKQIELLAKIMRAQGWRSPIVVSARSGFIVKGHGRLQAAQMNEWAEAPVDMQDYATEADEYADMVADNKIAELSETNLSMVLEDVLQLGPDFDFDLLGIPDFKLPEDFAPQNDENSVPGVPLEPKTKAGDLYRLGRHRLLCGDATVATDVALLLNDTKPTLMVTDPPYGVEYEAGWRAEAKGVKKTDRENTSSLQGDSRADWYDAWVLFPGAVAYVWHASAFTDVVMDSLRRAGFEVRQQIIWNKNVHALSRSHYHWKHEPCWYAVKAGAEASWLAGRDQKTVWDIPNVMFEKDKTSHPTQKALGIYEVPIENHTRQGDSVYEPFGGSGTSLIACEKHGRVSFTMELDPKFCDVIVKRWEQYTGKQAELING